VAPSLEPSPDLVARLRAAGCVFAEEEAQVLVASADSAAALEAMVERRVAGEPLEHVVGWVDFAGVRVGIAPGVFIPRQRTALMVELARRELTDLEPPERPAVVVDLGCGTGALGLVLARSRPSGQVVVHAVDIEPAAVACARRNLAGVPGAVHLGDLDAPLPASLEGRVDVLLANMPYVPTAALPLMPAESREHEPPVTVDGGPDGLELVRRAAGLATRWLRPGGTVWVETGEDQADATAYVFEERGLVATVHRDEERGATVVAGRAPGRG
jgi:release factor glutamine methyltransferase